MVTAGEDGHLKIIQVECDNEIYSHRCVYNIKMPAGIVSFDISSDGNHFAVGLHKKEGEISSTTLLVRSK